MDRNLIELYGILEELKLKFDNSFTQDEREYYRLKIVEVNNLIRRLEEILKISEDMGVEIVDGTSGKHYILDDLGREIEFSVDMLMGEKESD